MTPFGFSTTLPLNPPRVVLVTTCDDDHQVDWEFDRDVVLQGPSLPDLQAFSWETSEFEQPATVVNTVPTILRATYAARVSPGYEWQILSGVLGVSPLTPLLPDQTGILGG